MRVTEELIFEVPDLLQTITAKLLRSKWSLLLLRNVVREAMTALFSLFPEIRVRVYVDDMQLHLAGQSVEVV